MGAKYLGDAGTGGSILGRDSADKIGFYGGTVTSRPSNANQTKVRTTALATTATLVTSSTVHGNIVSDLDAVKTLVNQLRDDFVTLNLIKGS